MSGFATIKRSLPALGIGLGLRREMAEETLAAGDQIDWLEFVPENYMGIGGMARNRIDAAKELFPLISHGINLSIGSGDELNYEYLRDIKALLDRLDCAWWSDHLCFSSIAGKYMHDLLPLPFTKEAVLHIAERIKRVQDFVGRPFLLENISYYMNLPGAEMTDNQFLAEVLEKADCGLLLDVNNVYVNSLNHKFDPREYLKQLPLERTVQMHVAGHKKIGDYTIDTHGAAVVEPVFELLQHVLEQTPVCAVMLERDQNFPAFEEILSELAVIRKIASSARPELVGQAQAKAVKPVQPAAAHHEPAHHKGGELRALSA